MQSVRTSKEAVCVYWGYISMAGMWILIPAIIFTMVAQAKVKSAFNTYSKVALKSGLTGADTARTIINQKGLYNVTVHSIAGNLTDNYNPSAKTLNLSQGVFGARSIAASAIAAHEMGHALQDAEEYGPLRLRSFFVPIANFGSKAAVPLIIIGLLAASRVGGDGLILARIGVCFFSFSVIFIFITLPVEFNASKRALVVLEETGIMAPEEIPHAKKVLDAAALTYVAAAASALANLLRLMLIVNGSRRR